MGSVKSLPQNRGRLFPAFDSGDIITIEAGSSLFEAGKGKSPERERRTSIERTI